ncbi:quinone oxidoreductase [Bordetella genomosp. 8]|uniref:Quinone oxidoreductase n=1 Tax=Bordetella genomosp. 8 TaxID=1416806 RepID=A0A1W6YMG3_9BORD|nr:zinc-dependent alcohol dehydrogenase family protein [Bordetella genomosp. 8]ARP82245.1 quinone oxidoreductase [Bordetella genomosp. 8]
MTTPTMRALWVNAPDAPFQLKPTPLPTPGAGEVLVRILASGVNPLDLKIRAGAAAHAQHPLPAILGMDLAGIVEKVGPGVSQFAPGDEVWAMAGGVAGVQGSMAEFVAVDARLLAHKPANLSMRQAAALPLAVITAWEGMVDIAAVQPGEKVLVIGAGGGVGHVAAQLARARGAEVHGVDGARSANYLRSIGVTPIARDTPVDAYVQEWTGGRGFDVVYDCVGALDAAFNAVRVHGRVTSSLGWGSYSLAPLSFRSARYAGVFTLRALITGEGRDAHGRILREAAQLAEAGQLTPRMDEQRFTLDQAEAAHARVRGGGATGKVVLELD